MKLERIIFSIDDYHNTHKLYKFLKFVDTERAMGKMSPVVPLIGSYEGKLEYSFMCLAKDYSKVESLGFTSNQNYVMRVPGDVRQSCDLEYKNGYREDIGPMREVSYDVARASDGWTYNTQTGKYFVCQKQ